MRDTGVYLENLSKGYRLVKRERYKALRDVLANGFAAHSGGLGIRNWR